MLFTPGPWSHNIKPASKYTVIFSGRNTHVASVTTSGLGEDEVEANRRLITTAPELYEALKKAYRELNTIHARDGKPWTGVPFPMPTDVDQEYFTSVVEECRQVLMKACDDI